MGFVDGLFLAVGAAAGFDSALCILGFGSGRKFLGIFVFWL